MEPREVKAVSAKIRVESFQYCLVVNSVEGRREVETDRDGVVTISTYVGKISEDEREQFLWRKQG